MANELPRNLGNIIDKAVEQSRTVNDISNKYTLDKAVAATSAYFGDETKKTIDALSFTLDESLRSTIDVVSTEHTLGRLLDTVSDQVVPLLRGLQKRKYERKAPVISPEVIKMVDGMLKAQTMPMTKDDDELVKAIEKGTFNQNQTRLMMEKFFDKMSQDALRAAANDTPVSAQTPQKVHDGDGKPVNLPSEKKVSEGVGILTGLGSFFGTIGGAAFRGVVKPLAKLGGMALLSPFRLLGSALSGIGGIVAKMSTLLLGSNFTGMFGRMFGFLGKFGKFAGGIGTVIGGAILADLWNSPEKIERYLSVFSSLWNDRIMPMFDWINTNVLMPIVEAFRPLLGDGGFMGALDKFASFVNETVLFFFEKVLPPVLDGIGFVLKKVTEGIMYVLIPAITLVLDIVTGIIDYVMNQVESFKKLVNGEISVGEFLVEFATNLISAVSGFLQSIVKFLGELVSFDKLAAYADQFTTWITQMVTNIMTGIGDWVMGAISSGIDVAGIIKDKVLAMVYAIADLIPSPSDIGNWIADNTTGRLSKWWNGEGEAPVIEPSVEPRVSEVMREAANIPPPAASNTVIIAPTTTNNVSNVSSTAGRSSGSVPKGIPNTNPPMSRFEGKIYGQVPNIQ